MTDRAALGVIPCRECGHSDLMHVRGMSPRYAGCMVRDLLSPRLRKPTCPCPLTPEQARGPKP